MTYALPNLLIAALATSLLFLTFRIKEK